MPPVQTSKPLAGLTLNQMAAGRALLCEDFGAGLVGVNSASDLIWIPCGGQVES